jgi:hypothetical protein
MSKAEIMAKASRTFHKVGFAVKKHSPEILVATGIVGGVASAIMACKATLKVDEVVEKHEDKVERIHKAAENGVTAAGKEYNAEDMKKDLAITYVQTGVDFAKLYGPSIVLGTLSITAILAGHNILRNRYVATAAAYAAVEKGFKEYRGRVVERFGEALDKELKYGIQAKEYEEIVANEDGTESVIKKNTEVVNPYLGSPYAIFFDDGCTGWTKDPEYNKMFLINQQRYANDLLKSKGVVVLNEVYDMLGAPRTKAGMVVGWRYDEKNPTGDNYIDFGIFDINREATRNFVNGYERTILLDFNVDGDVYSNA